MGGNKGNFTVVGVALIALTKKEVKVEKTNRWRGIEMLGVLKMMGVRRMNEECRRGRRRGGKIGLLVISLSPWKVHLGTSTNVHQLQGQLLTSIHPHPTACHEG